MVIIGLFYKDETDVQEGAIVTDCHISVLLTELVMHDRLTVIMTSQVNWCREHCRLCVF